MVANETKLVKQPAASTGGESRAGARDARLSRGQEGVITWNNGKEVPRWGVAEIQKMSPSTTGRCK